MELSHFLFPSEEDKVIIKQIVFLKSFIGFLFIFEIDFFWTQKLLQNYEKIKQITHDCLHEWE